MGVQGRSHAAVTSRTARPFRTPAPARATRKLSWRMPQLTLLKPVQRSPDTKLGNARISTDYLIISRGRADTELRRQPRRLLSRLAVNPGEPPKPGERGDQAHPRRRRPGKRRAGGPSGGPSRGPVDGRRGGLGRSARRIPANTTISMITAAVPRTTSLATAR